MHFLCDSSVTINICGIVPIRSLLLQLLGRFAKQSKSIAREGWTFQRNKRFLIELCTHYAHFHSAHQVHNNATKVNMKP